MKLAQNCASAATPPDETSPGLCLCSHTSWWNSSPGLCLCSHTLVQWPERLCSCSSVCLSVPVSLVGCMVCSLLVKLTAQRSSTVAPPQSGLSACCGVALVWSSNQHESVQFAWQHVRSCSCSPAGCSLLIKLPTWHCSAVAPPRLGVAQKSVHSVFGKVVSLCLLWGCLGTSQCESVQLAWQNVTGCSRSPAGSPLPPEKCEISIGNLKSSKVQAALFYAPSPWWTGVVLCGLYLRHSKTERILCWTEARSIYVCVRESVCVCACVCAQMWPA